MDGDGRPDVVAVYEEAAMQATAVRVMLQRDRPVSTYCAPKVNSLGCVPEITHSGLPSASAGSGFTIGASRVLAGKAGLFFYGHNGQLSTPFQGGTMCLQVPRKRMPLQTASAGTGCAGTFATDFNLRIASGVDPLLVAGARVCGQWWSRDSGFTPPNNTGLTNAIDFVVQP